MNLFINIFKDVQSYVVKIVISFALKCVNSNVVIKNVKKIVEMFVMNVYNLVNLAVSILSVFNHVMNYVKGNPVN